MRKHELKGCPQWLLDADTENENVDFDEFGFLQWYGGDFLGGNFWGGNFRGGNFRGGDFRGGNFRGGDFWRGNFLGGDFWGGNFLGGDFWGGNFLGGNFRGGNFWGEKLTKRPQTIYGLEWVVVITKEQMQIGCQRHTHAQWEAFGNDEIDVMHSKASSFWSRWKDPLLVMCEQHRKEVAA